MSLFPKCTATTADANGHSEFSVQGSRGTQRCKATSRLKAKSQDEWGLRQGAGGGRVMNCQRLPPAMELAAHPYSELPSPILFYFLRDTPHPETFEHGDV